MAGIHHIKDETSAVALADLLNGTARRKPVVVITAPAARVDPWIDAEEVAREAGNLADVYLMATGPITWEFSKRMAEGTQVYGGAGRVYPVGHEWTTDLKRSPLRFAFNAQDGERATHSLVSDTLRMAAASGLLQSLPKRELRKVEGVVRMVVAGRALVDVGNVMPAAIAEELTVEGVPIDRLLLPGQRVEGWYDRESNRIDVTSQLRSSIEALASYAVGDVVMSRVATLRNGKAELVLYPKTGAHPAVSVMVLRDDVTMNPVDDLRTLMTVGEVIPARVVATGPQWVLRLNDIDDDEPVVTAPALLPGGPPWLIEEEELAEVGEPPGVQPPPAPMPAEVLEPLAEGADPLPAPVARPAPPAPPSPALLDKSRVQRPSPPAVHGAAPQPAPTPTRGLLLKIDALNAQVSALQRQVGTLTGQVRAGQDEHRQLRYLMDQADRRAGSAEHDLKVAKARLRKAGAGKANQGAPAIRSAQFADAEQGFRYLVLTQWATRTLVSEQKDRPLPEYLIGPGFLDSLAKLEGIKAEKVADVVFEIVTGLAPGLASREVHQLRTGSGGDDAVLTREDGAVAWRASLQVNTPSARRIHYWALPNGQVELARVTTHDGFNA